MNMSMQLKCSTTKIFTVTLLLNQLLLLYIFVLLVKTPLEIGRKVRQAFKILHQLVIGFAIEYLLFTIIAYSVAA